MIFKVDFGEFLLGVSSHFQTKFQVGVFSVTWRTFVTFRKSEFQSYFLVVLFLDFLDPHLGNRLTFHLWAINLL